MEVRMLFMVSSRARSEATREQLIEHLTRRLDPATWDLIRQGVVSHVLYKVGEEPGFFAVLSDPLSIVQRNEFPDLLKGPSVCRSRGLKIEASNVGC
jgi:hypothetical protein